MLFNFILIQGAILSDDGKVVCILKLYTSTGREQNKPREQPLARHHLMFQHLHSILIKILCVFSLNKNRIILVCIWTLISLSAFAIKTFFPGPPSSLSPEKGSFQSFKSDTMYNLACYSYFQIASNLTNLFTCHEFSNSEEINWSETGLLKQKPC